MAKYGEVEFANNECHEYDAYKKLKDALEDSKKLDLGKLYKSLKEKIKSAESSYRKYALAYKHYQRNDKSAKFDDQMTAKNIKKLVNLSLYAKQLKGILENFVEGISGFTKDNVECNGKWVTKKKEKEDKKAAEKQKKEEEKRKKAEKKNSGV